MQEVVGSTPIFSTFNEFYAFSKQSKTFKKYRKTCKINVLQVFLFSDHLQNFQKRTKYLWHWLWQFSPKVKLPQKAV
jgi:hypothetical protein